MVASVVAREITFAIGKNNWRTICIMADHINISAPRMRYELQDQLETAKMRAELDTLRMHYDSRANDLASIFNRIARGEQVELHYPDGTVIPITRARKRGEKDGGEA